MSPNMSHPGRLSPRDYSTVGGPQIKLEQPPSSQPGNHQYPGGSGVPNVLQPGSLGAGRQAPMAASAAPTVPTMSGAMQPSPSEYSPPSKPPALSLAQAYPRSSPVGPYEGGPGYAPYTPTTPGGSAAGPSQFVSPQDRKFGSQRNVSNTPLGLADIRPRADSGLSDGPPGTLGYELANSQPSASNYLAPWALYAFDWCKWAPQGKGAGKVAVGSYLEDGHNFVRPAERPGACGGRRGEASRVLTRCRYKSWIPRSSTPLPTSTPPARPSTASSSTRSPKPPTRIPSPASCGSRRPPRSKPPISWRRRATTCASGRCRRTPRRPSRTRCPTSRPARTRRRPS